MKKIPIISLIFLTSCSASQIESALSSNCGISRLAIRTATDPESNQINPNLIIPISISELKNLPNPHPNLFRDGFEKKIYKLTAKINHISGPLSDSDYHLRIYDDFGNKMIAESVDPKCASGSKFLSQIKNTRNKISSLPLNTNLIFTGIGFWDREHNVIYASPNNVELHPLLNIEKGN